MFWEAVARLGGGSGGGSGRPPGGLWEASGEAPREASQATFRDVIRLEPKRPAFSGLLQPSPAFSILLQTSPAFSGR